MIMMFIKTNMGKAMQAVDFYELITTVDMVNEETYDTLSSMETPLVSTFLLLVSA